MTVIADDADADRPRLSLTPTVMVLDPAVFKGAVSNVCDIQRVPFADAEYDEIEDPNIPEPLITTCKIDCP